MTFVQNTPPPANPVSDYSSRDYQSVYADLLDRIPVYLPNWTSQSPNDFGIVMLQMYAYVCDLLGYYLDRLAGEAFIQTATQAVSIVNLAAMLDYQPTLSSGSTVELTITLGDNQGPVVIPAGTPFSTLASPNQAAITFVTTADLTITGASSATPQMTGTVLAVQGVIQQNEAVATSDGTINQIYPLLFNPVSSDSFTVSVDLGLGPQEWSFVQSLLNSGPTAQVFTTFVDANDVFYIIFGDNVNGYVPPLGSPIYCTYQTNVGSLGNVGAGTITQVTTALMGVVGVNNAAGASGGADTESLASIQEQAPASLKTLNRAVTVSDIETLAIQVAGVEWASSLQVTYQLVNLFIAPFGGGTPTPALVSAVQNYLSGSTPLVMANTTVTVLPPTYVEINISANVVAFANYGNDSTEAVVSNALSTLLSLPETGFGTRISLGLVYQMILEQVGVNYAIVTGLNRQMLAILTVQLTINMSVTSITVTALPQAITAGDSLVLTNLSGAKQTITATQNVAAGQTSIPVAFTPTNTFQINSTIQDATGTNDCILLPNEIPIVGSLNLNVTGGVIGS